MEAISEATIQVLLTHGAERLTTTRVAERAGVSVGTLYQYYPNKRSLLFAVFEDHLNKVARAVEAACEARALQADVRNDQTGSRGIRGRKDAARRHFRGPVQSRARRGWARIGQADRTTVAESD